MNPHYISRGRKFGKAAAINFIPQPLSISLFNFSHKWPTFAFTPESGYTTLGSAQRIAHSGTHGETGGVSDRDAITTLGALCVLLKRWTAGCQNGKLCRFGGLVGGAPEERRKPAGQRCAYARRCPEASRPRWAALPCCRCSFSLTCWDGKTWPSVPAELLSHATTARPAVWRLCRDCVGR